MVQIMKFTPEEEGGLGFWTLECEVPAEQVKAKLAELRALAPCSEFK